MKTLWRLVAAALLFVLATVTAPRGDPGRYEYKGQWGSEGKGDGQFLSPVGVAVYRHDVYVADTGNHRIQYFAATGSFLGKWGSEGGGPGQFREPHGVAVARDGTTYVTDKYNHRLQIFTSTGSFLGQIGSEGKGDGQFRCPTGVAVHPLSGEIYVVDTLNRRVQRFGPDGVFLGKWSGEGEGRLGYPLGIALSPRDDLVYVTEGGGAGGRHRVLCFTAAGSFVTSWGSEGSAHGEFRFPAGVAVTGDGYGVLVADKGNGRVQEFTSEGYFASAWGRWGAGDGEFNHPRGLAASRYEGLLYVVDSGNHRVQFFALPPPPICGGTPRDGCGGCGGVLY
jgi:DNA-binding beta-propeller fold protein YncE